MKLNIIEGEVQNLCINKSYIQYGYTLDINFSIKNLDITLPSQTKKANLLKNGDNIIISYRKSLFKSSNFIGLAYKYCNKDYIYAINEKWNYINASIAIIVSLLSWFFLPEQRVVVIFAFFAVVHYFIEAYQATIAKKSLSRLNVKL